MQNLGSLLGWLTWYLSAQYRRQFIMNTQLAGVSADDARRAISSAGKLVGEIPFLWARASHIRALSRAQMENSDFIEKALADKRGVIFLAPHLGSWEYGAQLLAETFGPRFGDLMALYRPARKAWVERLLLQLRAREHLQQVPTTFSGVRSLLKHLKAGGFTAILPDQVPPNGLGVWAPFFGRDVYTMTLLPKLAQQTGAMVVLAWCERLPGARFKCHFQDLSHLELGSKAISMEQACIRMNQAIEQLILGAPDQYLWGYNRAKKPRQSVHTKPTQEESIS
jgi:KDO2-lipid IV(A) lauroyltransferase